MSFEVIRRVGDLSVACRAKHDDLCVEWQVAYEMGDFTQWPEKINTNQKWETCGVLWEGAWTKEREKFPILAGIVDQFGGQLHTAGYSLLLPGAEIAPHRGYTNKVLRMHYGLYIPDGDLGLGITDAMGRNHVLRWGNKESTTFDDTLEHSAWNRTKDVRVVVLFDLLKETIS